MYKRTNTIIFIIAIILGVIAIYFIMGYINDIKETYTNVSMMPVVVAVQNIPEHVNITHEMLKIVEVPTEMILPQAYDSVENVVGSITKTDIVKDEHILSNHIYREGEGRDKFSYSVPENMRALSIAISDVSGVSGLIKPNDRVDILLTYTYAEDNLEQGSDETDEGEVDVEAKRKMQLAREYLRKISDEIMKDRRIVTIDAKEMTITMMQNIQVLAIYGSDNQSSSDENKKDSGTISLALDPEDVELLTNAEAIGNLKLSLRSPVDEKILELEPIISSR